MRNITYRDRTCEKCSKTFTPTSSKQKWCKDCLKKPCKNCGTIVEVRNRSKYEQTNFCSRKCHGEYNSRVHVGENAFNFKNRSMQIVCANCGKIATKAKRFVERFEHSFCNQDCYNEYQRKHRTEVSGESSPHWNKVTKVCEWCGDEYETWPSTQDATRFCSQKCRNDWQSKMMQGENHYNWQSGKSEERHLDMSSREYRAWRTAVFERDQYTCQTCGDKRGGNLEAHHLKGWAEYPELRHVVSNGITLCEDCHRNEHYSKQDIQSDPPQ